MVLVFDMQSQQLGGASARGGNAAMREWWISELALVGGFVLSCVPRSPITVATVTW